MYRSSPLAVSGGVALGIPSGDDTNVHITDYSGSTVNGLATIQRQRDIHIDNEAWSLSPFLAALYTPTDRFFTQGFVQVDFPLNASTIDYRDTFLRGSAPSIGQLSQAGLIASLQIVAQRVVGCDGDIVGRQPARGDRPAHQSLEHRRRAPDGVMPVDVAIHLILREQQRLERRQALGVQRQPIGGHRERRQEPVHIDDAVRHATHRGITRQIVELVDVD